MQRANVPYRSLLQESAHSNIHLVKLTRLLRLARLLQKMDRYSQYSAVILTMLMLFFIVVAHWLACIWYVIAEKERLRNDKDWDLGESLEAALASFNNRKLHSATFRNVTKFLREMWDMCMNVADSSRIRKYSLSISILKQLRIFVTYKIAWRYLSWKSMSIHPT